MTPKAIIEINGRDRDARFYERLVSFSITDEAGVRADTLEFTLVARPDELGGVAAPPIGAEIRAWLGYEPKPVFMGSYRVDSWTKAGPVLLLTVSAKAADLTGKIRAPKLRSHHDTTVAAIVEKIAGEHGLTAVVDAEIGARKIPHIDQQTESDLGFLSRLAKRQGATFKVAAGNLIFTAKGSRTKPGGAAKTPIIIRPEQCSVWQADSGERGGYKSASAEYMDHAAGQRRQVRQGTEEPVRRDRRLYGSREEAEAACKATLGDLKRGKVMVTLDMPGAPELYAEALIVLEGFDPDVDGEFLVKTVRHDFSSSGFTTSVTLETEGDGETAE